MLAMSSYNTHNISWTVIKFSRPPFTIKVVDSPLKYSTLADAHIRWKEGSTAFGDFVETEARKLP